MEDQIIEFHFEEIEVFDLNQEKLTDWISRIIDKHGFILTSINYILCNDEYLLNVNKEYLDHDYYTDIITFDNSDKHEMIEGDIFLSIDRIKDNANTFNNSFETELKRVLAHGVLHLCGFKDKTEEEAKTMREQENTALEMY